MKIQTAILTVFFLFLFMGSVSADYVGTIETWTETLTCTTREWGEIDTWTNTLTASEAPGEDWDTVETWTNTLTAQVDYVPPDPPEYYSAYVVAEVSTSVYKTDLYGKNAVYVTAHDTYTGYSNVGLVGQAYYGGNYYVYRNYVVFDLTDVSYEILGASLFLTGYVDNSTTDFYIQVRECTVSSLATDTTTFNAYGADVFAQISSEDYSADERGMQLDFNEDGLTFLNDNLGETIIFMLVSSRDMSSTEPTGDEAVQCKTPSSGNDEEERPVLALSFDVMWTTIDTWTETLTVSPYAEWEEIDTWTETLTVSGEEESDYPGPLVPWNTLIVKILLPMILLFSVAFILHGEIGFVGFIIGSMIGLFIVYTTIGMPLGLVILGLFTLAAIWWRMD